VAHLNWTVTISVNSSHRENSQKQTTDIHPNPNVICIKLPEIALVKTTHMAEPEFCNLLADLPTGVLSVCGLVVSWTRQLVDCIFCGNI